MTRLRRLMMVALMLVSMGFLVGDDCEVDFEDFHWPHYYDTVIYEPVPVYDVVPYYPEPVFFY